MSANIVEFFVPRVALHLVALPQRLGLLALGKSSLILGALVRCGRRTQVVQQVLPPVFIRRARPVEYIVRPVRQRTVAHNASCAVGVNCAVLRSALRRPLVFAVLVLDELVVYPHHLRVVTETFRQNSVAPAAVALCLRFAQGHVPVLAAARGVLLDAALLHVLALLLPVLEARRGRNVHIDGFVPVALVAGPLRVQQQNTLLPGLGLLTLLRALHALRRLLDVGLVKLRLAADNFDLPALRFGLSPAGARAEELLLHGAVGARRLELGRTDADLLYALAGGVVRVAIAKLRVGRILFVVLTAAALVAVRVERGRPRSADQVAALGTLHLGVAALVRAH